VAYRLVRQRRSTGKRIRSVPLKNHGITMV
jgi:hypothetical protein